MIEKLTSSDIRSRFLAFFEKRGHTVIPSASLVTPDEKGITNATLFNTAGMQPLVPYLLGKPYIVDGRNVTRLVNSQKCVRTVDIDDIGDKTHATFFEMLGNWSLGDYFKREAIEWSYEFLTSKSTVPGDQGLGLDPNQLYVTVFEGDSVAPRDNEAADIWRDIFTKNGIEVGGDTTKGEKGRIFYLPAKNNWWEAGDNGPCGPDTEMFYDISGKFSGKLLTHAEFVAADDVRDVVEVWNDVFMQYEKKDGKIIGKLQKPSVDTGAGLERLTMTLQGVDNIYDTDLFNQAMHRLGQFEEGYDNSESSTKSKHIIVDHIRASVFLISDGVRPSNTDRGYILRKLLRRAYLQCDSLGMKNASNLSIIAQVFIRQYQNIYPDLEQNHSVIAETIKEEMTKIILLEEKSNIIMEKIFDDYTNRKGKSPITVKEVIPGKGIKPDYPFITPDEAFELYSSHGIPKEKILKFIRGKGFIIDIDAFQKLFSEKFKAHQDLSRAGAEQKFKGGLADANDPMVVRYHTATHLLHQALHDVLGESEGNQKGSNITAERLRFDFTGVKLTDEQKKRVEDIVNEKIAAALPMNNVVLPRAEADKTGARHFFGEKYGEEISIYFIGPTSGNPTTIIDDIKSAYSKEFCGGPHVKNTGELAGPEGKWRFKIQKEEAVSQGVRRIKAVLG
jgi:alanyl-tRNA synthetase